MEPATLIEEMSNLMLHEPQLRKAKEQAKAEEDSARANVDAVHANLTQFEEGKEEEFKQVKAEAKTLVEKAEATLTIKKY